MKLWENEVGQYKLDLKVRDMFLGVVNLSRK